MQGGGEGVRQHTALCGLLYTDITCSLLVVPIMHMGFKWITRQFSRAQLLLLLLPCSAAVWQGTAAAATFICVCAHLQLALVPLSKHCCNLIVAEPTQHVKDVIRLCNNIDQPDLSA